MREFGPFVLAWYHPHDLEPTYEIEPPVELDDPDFSEWTNVVFRVSAACQEMAENSVDGPHFRYVHNTAIVPEIQSYDVDGVRTRMRSIQRFPTPAGVVDGRIDVDNQGPGFAITRFSGIVDTLLVGAAIPVDLDQSEVRFSFRTRKVGDAATTSTVGDAFVAEVCKQFEEDRPIWENKAHVVRPGAGRHRSAVHEVPQVVRAVLRRRRRHVPRRCGPPARRPATASRCSSGPRRPPRPSTAPTASPLRPPVPSPAGPVVVVCAVRSGQRNGVEAESASDVTATPRLTWWVSFVIIATLAAIWTFAIPLMDSPDEPTQAIKAASVARGELTTGYTDVTSVFGIRPVTKVVVPAPTPSCDPIAGCFASVRVTRGRSARSAPVSGARRPVTAGTYVGAYPPLYYAMVGWPSRVLRPEDALYAMRLIGALVCSALLASGLASAARCGRRRLLVAASALGVTPMVIFLTASINPNGLEIASAFCAWLAALELVGRHRAPLDPAAVLRVGVSSVLLVGSRPLSPVLLVIILGTVALLAADPSALRRLAHDLRARVMAVVVAAATVGSAFYVAVNHATTAIIQFPLPGASLARSTPRADRSSSPARGSSRWSVCWVG